MIPIPHRAIVPTRHVWRVSWFQGFPTMSPARQPPRGHLFEDGDHEIYLDLLAEQTLKAGVAVWAYCLMPNHVHLILKPVRADDLGRAVGEAHRQPNSQPTIRKAAVTGYHVPGFPDSPCPLNLSPCMTAKHAKKPFRTRF